MSGVELAACPFDGCAAEVRLAMDEFRRARHVVVCRGCGAKSDSSIGEQAAIAAWNRRAVPMEAVAWREAVEDVISHTSDWRTALTAMRENAGEPETGVQDDRSYWQHQLDVLDRILQALAVIPTQGAEAPETPAPPNTVSTDEEVGNE